MDKIELRALSAALSEMRIETDDAGKPRFVGYAAVFNSLSEDLGGFREIIRPGAFARCLAGADVRALFNHDPSIVLGRTGASTCRLVEDSRGLRYEVDPPNTHAAQDVAELVKRGDVSGSSFRFYMFDDENRGQSWRSEPTGVIREITEFAAIDDVSIVTYPAYLATQAALRALEAHRRSQPRRTPRRDRAGRLLSLAEAL